jgi:hypothetical protein
MNMPTQLKLFIEQSIVVEVQVQAAETISTMTPMMMAIRVSIVNEKWHHV